MNPPVPVQPVPFPPDTATGRAYTVEGALVGGAVSGTTTAAIVAALCAGDDGDPSLGACALRATVGLIAGAMPGMVVGGAIGAMIEKRPPSESVAAGMELHRSALSLSRLSVRVTLLRIPIGSP